jgi:hypothetical protein
VSWSIAAQKPGFFSNVVFHQAPAAETRFLDSRLLSLLGNAIAKKRATHNEQGDKTEP